MDKITENPFQKNISDLSVNNKNFKYVNLPSLNDPRISKLRFKI